LHEKILTSSFNLINFQNHNTDFVSKSWWNSPEFASGKIRAET